MEKMLVYLIEKAKEEIHNAMTYAMKIETAKDKTDILNAEYHMGKFSAFMDIIEELSMEEFVKLGEDTKDMRQFILEGIDKLYR